MTDRQPSFTPAQGSGIRVRIEIRDVRDVVPFFFHPVRQWKLPEEELARPNRKRCVDNLTILAVRPVETGLDVRSPVPLLVPIVVKGKLARPPVVSIPRRVGNLKQEIGLALVAHDED